MRKNTKMKSSEQTPFFIDAIDRMVEGFYDQFENEFGEAMFLFMTEAMGRQRRTLCEASEAINGAIHGHDMFKLLDDEIEELPYDEFFMQNADLSGQVMARLIRRFADEY